MWGFSLGISSTGVSKLRVISRRVRMLPITRQMTIIVLGGTLHIPLLLLLLMRRRLLLQMSLLRMTRMMELLAMHLLLLIMRKMCQ